MTETPETIKTKAEKIDSFVKLVPKGQSPKTYVTLLKEQVMGVDKNKNPRSDEDLMLFMYVCKRTGLDPIVKQIYPVFRWDSSLGKEKMTIQVGIDGFRLVAQRTGQYGGSDDAIFDVEDQDHPNKATITVYKMNSKTGERMPITASARWKEYCQMYQGKPMGLWTKMPYTMLAKCAESLALRKAFPNELSGVYTSEELGQAGNTSAVADLPVPTDHKKALETGKGKDIPSTDQKPQETAKNEEKKPLVSPITKDDVRPTIKVPVSQMRESLKK